MIGCDDDIDAWERFPEYRWVYDRLELCKRLGYDVGPAGTPFPRPGKWYSKPQINIRGMGAGGKVVTDPKEVPPGHIWMPYFTGAQFSINYDMTSGRIVESLYALRNESKPVAWIKTTEVLELPDVLKTLDVPKLNVEFIDGKVVEVHLRWGLDFREAPKDATMMIPVWSNEADSWLLSQMQYGGWEEDDADGYIYPQRIGVVYL